MVLVLVELGGAWDWAWDDSSVEQASARARMHRLSEKEKRRRRQGQKERKQGSGLARDKGQQGHSGAQQGLAFLSSTHDQQDPRANPPNSRPPSPSRDGPDQSCTGLTLLYSTVV